MPHISPLDHYCPPSTASPVTGVDLVDDITPPPPHIAFFTHGYGDDAEYEYVNPASVRVRELEQQGIHVPSQDDYRRPPPPNPIRSDFSSALSELLVKGAIQGSLTADICNTTPASTVPSSQDAISSGTNKENQPAVRLNTEDPIAEIKFTVSDLVLVASKVIEHSPFMEMQERTVSAWKKVKASLAKGGFRHAISLGLLRTKAEAMVAYCKVSYLGIFFQIIIDKILPESGKQ